MVTMGADEKPTQLYRIIKGLQLLYIYIYKLINTDFIRYVTGALWFHCSYDPVTNTPQPTATRPSLVDMLPWVHGEVWRNGLDAGWICWPPKDEI